MTDLEQLRALAAWLSADNEAPSSGDAACVLDAADEIERLRHELDRYSMIIDPAEEIVCVCGHSGPFSTHPANGCGFGPFVPKRESSTGTNEETTP